MEPVKYSQKQRLAADLSKLNDYIAYSLRKIETKEPKEVLAAVINKHWMSLYKSIKNCSFKKWEIINMFNFLLGFYETNCRKNTQDTTLQEKLGKDNHNWRLDISEQRLNQLYNEYTTIHYELSRSLRNISSRNVSPKKKFAEIIGVSLNTYHDKAKNKSFTTNELIKIFYFLVIFYKKHYNGPKHKHHLTPKRTRAQKF